MDLYLTTAKGQHPCPSVSDLTESEAGFWHTDFSHHDTGRRYSQRRVSHSNLGDEHVDIPLDEEDECEEGDEIDHVMRAQLLQEETRLRARRLHMGHLSVAQEAAEESQAEEERNNLSSMNGGGLISVEASSKVEESRRPTKNRGSPRQTPNGMESVSLASSVRKKKDRDRLLTSARDSSHSPSVGTDREKSTRNTLGMSARRRTSAEIPDSSVMSKSRREATADAESSPKRQTNKRDNDKCLRSSKDSGLGPRKNSISMTIGSWSTEDKSQDNSNRSPSQMQSVTMDTVTDSKEDENINSSSHREKEQKPQSDAVGKSEVTSITDDDDDFLEEEIDINIELDDEDDTTEEDEEGPAIRNKSQQQTGGLGKNDSSPSAKSNKKDASGEDKNGLAVKNGMVYYDVSTIHVKDMENNGGESSGKAGTNTSDAENNNNNSNNNKTKSKRGSTSDKSITKRSLPNPFSSRRSKEDKSKASSADNSSSNQGSGNNNTGSSNKSSPKKGDSTRDKDRRELEMEVIKLKIELAHCKGELDESQWKNKKLAEERAQLEDSCSEYKTKVATLEESNKVWSSDESALKILNVKMVDELAAIRKERDALKSQNQSLRSEADRMKVESMEMHKVIEQMKQSTEDLVKERDRLAGDARTVDFTSRSDKKDSNGKGGGSNGKNSSNGKGDYGGNEDLNKRLRKSQAECERLQFSALQATAERDRLKLSVEQLSQENDDLQHQLNGGVGYQRKTNFLSVNRARVDSALSTWRVGRRPKSYNVGE